VLVIWVLGRGGYFGSILLFHFVFHSTIFHSALHSLIIEIVVRKVNKGNFSSTAPTLNSSSSCIERKKGIFSHP